MLCQLVCVDRRYQRMNCFNIREIQSLLKRKFFIDLINTHDHHTLLDKTALGLRFKTNNINNVNNNIFIFYNYGIEFTPKFRNISYTFDNLNTLNLFNNQSLKFNLINYFNKFNIFFILNNIYINLIQLITLNTPLNFFFKNL